MKLYILILLSTASLFGCEMSRDSNDGKRFTLAESAGAYVWYRVQAASDLNRDDRVRLETILLSRISDKHDAQELDTITILGAIGGSRTIDILVKIDNAGETPGRIRAAVLCALENIERTRNYVHPPSTDLNP